MLKDKVVFITGASSGIGYACAEIFAKANCKLILCARRLDLVDALAEKLRAAFNVEIVTFALDVTDHKAVEKSIKALPIGLTIDILINNAGLASGLDLLFEGNIEDWETMINTNVKGLLYVTREILPHMVKRNSGHVINIGSIAGHTVYPKGAVYCATKYAVKALSEGLRMDLFDTKVRVSTVDPGAVETNFSLVRYKGDVKRAASLYEGMEALHATDIADAVFYCASRPAHVNISEMIVMPTDQASATMIARKNK